MHIPELQKNLKINKKVHIETKGFNCPYDLILGLDAFLEVGMILNFREDTIYWDNSVAWFKSASTLNAFDPDEIMAID